MISSTPDTGPPPPKADVAQLAATLRAAGGKSAVCRHLRLAIGPASGVGLMMFAWPGRQRVVNVDGPFIEPVEDLQIDLGQGPCFDAVRTGRPVLVDDLAATSATLRWAALTVPARRHGAAALFSFPVLVGDLPVAVLDLCRGWPGPLSLDHQRLMILHAAATASLLSDEAPEPAVPLDDVRLHRATGIVMGQIGTNAAAAARRLRRHASGQGQELTDVVDAVLAGELRFDSPARRPRAGAWPAPR
ncbi:GAF domain-containing protein [Actinoplanes sp. NPDC026619]|uniref:GAF domain-containing protein n=1 Tax=Actinoplanes sp. NPDC026619 TaxID=3155798 RepID=UPI0033E08BD2